MGTTDRPGSSGDSTPTGPSHLDRHPGRRPEDDEPWLTDDQLAALIATDPLAHEPWAGFSAAELAWHLAAGSFAEEDPGAELSDADIARLIATAPVDDYPATAEHPETTNHPETAEDYPDAVLLPSVPAAGGKLFPVPVVPAPWADPGQADPALSRPGPGVAARVRMLRAAVPDLPTAPRPNNPAGVVWSPVPGADALAGLDPAALGENDLLDYVHSANRLAAWARGREATALAVFATRRPPLAGEDPATDPAYRSRYADAEIMALYAIGRGRAHTLLDQATTLATQLPATAALHNQGLLDELRLHAIHRGLENVPPTLLPTLEPLFLPHAARMNPAALTRTIRRLAQDHNPESLTTRHGRARKNRTVWFTPLPDGMAQLGATLDAVIAKSLYDSLDLWARTAQHQGTPSTATTPTGQPSRSLNNYRADAHTDILHHAILHPAGTCTTCTCPHPTGAAATNGDPGTAAGTPAPNIRFRSWPPARIEIQVPALTMLGRSEDPGHLTGYGPIPPGQAREFAAGAHTWTRILTDPATDTPLNLARTSYHPTAAIAATVRHRDPVCTGIGCDHPAASCELDHTTPFYMNRYRPDGTLEPKGQTSLENLRPRDRYCHQLKDNPHTGWTITPDDPGRTKTTTPTGRTYLHLDDPAPF